MAQEEVLKNAKDTEMETFTG